MQIYRIADSRHPIWSGQGAAIFGGRWNRPGLPVIYASTSYACAMLEVLVHSGNGRTPKNHKCVIAQIQTDVSIEQQDEGSLPAGWNDHTCEAAQSFGSQWFSEARCAVLIVPSVVAPFEKNALINPNHPDFGKIVVQPPIEVLWDSRLFRRT